MAQAYIPPMPEAAYDFADKDIQMRRLLALETGLKGSLAQLQSDLQGARAKVASANKDQSPNQLERMIRLRGRVTELEIRFEGTKTALADTQRQTQLLSTTEKDKL